MHTRVFLCKQAEEAIGHSPATLSGKLAAYTDGYRASEHLR